MDLYDILLFVHVASIALWLGGSVMFYVLLTRLRSAGSREAMSAILEQGEKLGPFFFAPVSLAALTAGLLMVFDGDWGFDEPFVLVGLVGFVAIFLVGAVFATQAEKKLLEALNDSTSSDQQVAQAHGKMMNLARLDTALLITVIFFMTVKPGT